MKSLPANLIAQKNLMHSPDPWLILLRITLTDAGPTEIRLVKNTEDITYDGDTWTHFPFQLSIVESNSDGRIPQVTLKVCNITRLLTPYLESLDGGIGSTVQVIVVNNKLLSEDYSELELEFSVMGCDADAYWGTSTLRMINPLNQRFPLYRYLATHCSWTFKAAECGYAGAATTCDRSFDDCIARENTAYFGGFLGMQSDGIRIA